MDSGTARAGTPRSRRIGHEMEYLRRLAEINPSRLRVERHESSGGQDRFEVLLATPAHSTGGDIVWEHTLSLVFPEYFPAVPIEAWLAEPVRHPNVHPENGFICLWSRHSPGDTVVEALLQAQRVLSGQLWNAEADHLMQPDATGLTALPFEPLRVPESYYLEKTYAQLPRGAVRRRLSPIE